MNTVTVPERSVTPATRRVQSSSFVNRERAKRDGLDVLDTRWALQ